MHTYIAAWVACAMVTTLFMARRGHSWPQWAIITGTLGPLAWPIAAFALYRPAATDVVPPMGVRVLLAVPPWMRSPEPMVRLVRQLDPHPLTASIVSVLDVEDRESPAGRVATEELEALLAQTGKALTEEELVDPPVECRILYGRPADELARFANAGEFRAIVLGPDGPRSHHLLQGHIRRRLMRLTAIAVLQPRDEQVVR